MALSTRRQFVQQTALAAAALYPGRFSAFLKDSPGGPSQNPALVDAASLRKLVSEISGQVFTPDASEYESARLVFNRAFDRRPAVFVRCAWPLAATRTRDFVQTHKFTLAVPDR